MVNDHISLKYIYQFVKSVRSVCISGIRSFTTPTLMMETEEVSEALVFSSTLIWLSPGKILSYLIPVKVSNLTKGNSS
jgi:hypothetical protein